MKKQYRVIIPPIAKESLRDIFEYIKIDSPSSAIKVQKKLIEIAKSLKNLPEKFSKEHYLSEKQGNYRSIVQWHYKIIYKVSENEVTIIRFMHTSRDPKRIEKIE